MDARDISIELEGRTYHALYWTEENTITVSTGLRSRRAQLGHTDEEAVARLPLREIVEEALLSDRE
jgi:hypothetical protein